MVERGFTIHLLLIVSLETEWMKELVDHLREAFPGAHPTFSLGDAGLLAGAYNSTRRQYNAPALMAHVNAALERHPARRVLTVVDVDLYAEGLNFVFGQAQCPGRYALVSTCRLRPEYYGGGDGERFSGRLRKEAIHELGHTLGVEHCPDRRCVMHFSNSLQDTDYKGDEFCQRCSRRMMAALAALR